jgi:tyrosinase
MSTSPALRVRRSIQELQDDYTKGNKKPLEDLMRAWKGIKELPPDDPKSFFVLGGYHGEPFRGAGWGNSSYWGGYCNHGNVLFPTWHRVYLLKLEEALQSIAGCGDVMLPFWDETSDDSLQNGVPWALTRKDFTLDGQTIPNPLRSFVFSKNIKDHISGDDPDYSKPKGYETVRYPLSGLVGPNDKAKTAAHNAQYPDYDTNVKLLNENVVAWLTSSIVVQGKVIPTNVHKKYRSIRGSFMVSAYAIIEGKKRHLGTEAILSRWHVEGCANCQTHREAKAFIGLHGLREESVHAAQIQVEVRTRDGLLSQPRAMAATVAARKPFHFEVR